MMAGIAPSRWWWDAHRFGLTPGKLVSRLRIHDGPLIVSNSLPKAGSHLLERALCRHPRIYRAPVRTIHRRQMERSGDLRHHLNRLQPNQLLLTHLEYSPGRLELLRSRGVRSLFMVRDPRDIVVSQAHFIGERPQHAHYNTFASIADVHERMRLVITGSGAYPSLHTRLESYAGWLSSDSLVVRYEDLIGGNGGGDDARQWAALSQIFEHVGLPLTEGEIADLAARTFSASSPTFRRGTTGQWRQHFDDSMLALYAAEVGDLASQYGYPIDDSSG